MWSKAHARESVAFGNVSIKLIVFEEGKGIDIEIERFCGDGIRVATRSELMKQIGFGSLGKSNSRHKMRNKEQTEKKATQLLRKECQRVFHKWHIRKFAE